MPDVWSTIARAEVQVQEQLADVLESVAAEPAAQATLKSFLNEIEFPEKSRVLEIGCGTGRVVRMLSSSDLVGQVVGVDPSPVFIKRARELAISLGNVSFEEMDGKELGFQAGEFDVVIIVRTLLHVPGPELVLAEANRVLRPAGTLAILEADGATISVALGDHDPLQNCVEAAKAAFLNDAWIVRKLPRLLEAAEFQVLKSDSYGQMRTSEPGVLLNQIDRGADTLAAWGHITSSLAQALKDEARNRVETGRFVAFMLESFFVARKAA